jgi:transposase InsO family protein
MAISIPGNSGLQYWGIPVCNSEDSYFALNSWKVQKRPDTGLVVGFFRAAVRKMKRLGVSSFRQVVMHQDRGSVYISGEYAAQVLSQGMYLSYSRRGEPGDNAVNEAFFSRLKEEWREVFWEAQDFGQLCRLVKRVVNYYNHKRLHSSLGYETPMAFVKSQAQLLTQNPLETVC